MHFEWDEAKSRVNVRERGLDFAFATLIFDGETVERDDARGDYGERRVVAMGWAGDVLLTVVYTDRLDALGREVRRIISARRSNRRERQTYAGLAEGR